MNPLKARAGFVMKPRAAMKAEHEIVEDMFKETDEKYLPGPVQAKMVSKRDFVTRAEYESLEEICKQHEEKGQTRETRISELEAEVETLRKDFQALMKRNDEITECYRGMTRIAEEKERTIVGYEQRLAAAQATILQMSEKAKISAAVLDQCRKSAIEADQAKEQAVSRLIELEEQIKANSQSEANHLKEKLDVQASLRNLQDELERVQRQRSTDVSLKTTTAANALRESRGKCDALTKRLAEVTRSSQSHAARAAELAEKLKVSEQAKAELERLVGIALAEQHPGSAFPSATSPGLTGVAQFLALASPQLPETPAGEEGTGKRADTLKHPETTEVEEGTRDSKGPQPKAPSVAILLADPRQRRRRRRDASRSPSPAVSTSERPETTLVEEGSECATSEMSEVTQVADGKDEVLEGSGPAEEDEAAEGASTGSGELPLPALSDDDLRKPSSSVYVSVSTQTDAALDPEIVSVGGPTPPTSSSSVASRGTQVTLPTVAEKASRWPSFTIRNVVIAFGVLALVVYLIGPELRRCLDDQQMWIDVNTPHRRDYWSRRELGWWSLLFEEDLSPGRRAHLLG